MIFEDWITSIAPALGMSTIQAGTFLALVLIAGFVLVVSISTKNLGASVLGAFLGLIVFLFMGWIPVWVGSVMALMLGIYATTFIRNRFR